MHTPDGLAKEFSLLVRCSFEQSSKENMYFLFIDGRRTLIGIQSSDTHHDNPHSSQAKLGALYSIEFPPPD
jgi:hypothetical protein